MLGRYRRRRLGPAFAWLGVAFYSSEIPARADRHVIAACASPLPPAAGGTGVARLGSGQRQTRQGRLPSRTEGGTRPHATAGQPRRPPTTTATTAATS